MTSSDIAVKGSDRTEGGLVDDSRDDEKMAIGASNRLADRMVVKETAVLETHHFLRKSTAKVASTVATEPLGQEEGPVTEQSEAIRKERGGGRKLSKTQRYRRDEISKMSREDRRGLLYRDAMALLLLGASTDPALDFNGIAGIEEITAADAIEDGAELADVTVDSLGRKMLRAFAAEDPASAEMRTVKGVYLSTTAEVPMTEEADDVGRSGVEERGRGCERRRTGGPLGQEDLKILAQAKFLSLILGPAHIFIQLTLTLVKGGALRKRGAECIYL